MNDNNAIITYNGIEKSLCKVCDKEIKNNDILVPFPSHISMEGIAHKHCMRIVKDE